MSSASNIHKTKGFHKWFRYDKELKNTDKCRGLHFYDSCNKHKNKQETQKELEEYDNNK